MFPRISSVVALIAFSAWLAREPGWEPAVGFIVSLFAYLGIEATQHIKEFKEEKNCHKARKNEIISAKVTKVDGLRFSVDIWYYYDGSLGTDDIRICVTPINRAGSILSGGLNGDWGSVSMIAHNAKMTLRFSYQPSQDENNNCHSLLITMEKSTDAILEHALRFRKDWNPKNTKEAKTLRATTTRRSV